MSLVLVAATGGVILLYLTLFLPGPVGGSISEAAPSPAAANSGHPPSSGGTPAGDPTAESSPPAVNGPSLIIVFDDAGHNRAQLDAVLSLPFPLTVAVLPRLAHSVEAAEAARRAGKEVILHQPMQAKNPQVNPGPGAIKPEMGAEEIAALVQGNMAEIGPVVGMNNHEGSRITESREAMTAVLDVCAAGGIYFLDSYTTAGSHAQAAADERGMKIWRRDVFLDNTPDRADVLAQLRRGLEIANRDGQAILIGHVWSPELPSILREVYPELVEKGYRFTTIGGMP